MNTFFAAGSGEESLLAEKNGVYYIARNMQENQILKQDDTHCKRSMNNCFGVCWQNQKIKCSALTKRDV